MVEFSNWFCLASVQWKKNLEIYRVKQLLNSTVTFKSIQSISVYLIVPKTDLFSVSQALSYLTSVCSAILTRSTTRIRWRPGICGFRTRVHTGVYVEKRPCHQYGNSHAHSLGICCKVQSSILYNTTWRNCTFWV